MTATDTHRAIEAVWRIESAKLIAGLVRMVRDIGLAEEFERAASLTRNARERTLLLARAAACGPESDTKGSGEV